MMFHKYTLKNEKIPTSTKIYMVLWIVVSLTLLFVFTFTLFSIALIAGVIIFLLRLLRKRPAQPPLPHQRPYRSNRNDQDVIDI
ncbi:MAG: hypothetical protein G3M78_10715 [Candidatus Nitrohelix vancouverensis]|uniref:Uncharacterized protein n=1 Tax=Candidatus Nitrohelix vancouverensis TaxID=2705534 RepID=A0A7T0C3F5_9BACT|nr:MAG: hypothetical protein G3M78_10715 [Candidatus Nitrohelix vancouverensis]